MKSSFKYLSIAVAAMVIVSCKNTNTQGRYIPANAAIAVHINGKSLSEKLPWAEIKNNPLFKDAYADSNMTATVKKMLDNPDNSGIDTKNDMQFFMQKDSLGGYLALEGSIKDEAAFKAFVTEMTENGTATEKDGVNYISRFPACVGWTKENFVVVMDAPQLGVMDAMSKRMGNPGIDRTGKPRDISATCHSIFALDKNKSLGAEEKFSKLLKESGDVHFWMNSEELYSGSATPAALAMLNLDKFYKGSFTAATFNFDNGKMTVNTHSYAGEELTKLYKKYSGGKVNEDMLKRMPGKDVMGLIALNFKPEALRDFLKMTNLEGFINIGAASLGFTLDDFIKANKGDIMIGLSDLKLVADTSTAPATDIETPAPPMPKPEFNFIFAASVGDKDAFNKLIATGKKAAGTFVNNGALPLAYNNNGSYFALANSQENADKYMAGAGSNTDLISKISGEPMAMYFNLQSLIKVFGSVATKDSSAKMLYDASLKLWDNVLMKGGNFSDGASTATIEINLVDKSTNSLKQLNQYIFTISEMAKEKQRKQKEDMMALEDAMNGGGMKDAAPAEEVKEK
ncbi:MAG: DUF4836 family protein [Chitinophagaceae bacterium]|nr:DUF4836 family protein [Chitinophagaceae bacterium]